MKILVYGAGVIGSYLAHILLGAGHDTTLLARGKRAEEIEKNGLVIRHYVQRKTTRDRVKVVRSLNPDDAYDIVFVVMQYTQMKHVIPTLAANAKSNTFVLIGNNPCARQMHAALQAASATQKRVLFGFLSVGGRREGETVVSIHAQRASDFTVGALDGGDWYRASIDGVFAKTGLRILHEADIHAMLLSHVAFILPLVFACYIYDGNLRRAFAKSQMRRKVIDAIDEGFRIVQSNGIAPTPESQVKLVRFQKRRMSLLLKVVAFTPLGRLGISDHAMSAKDEMRALMLAFRKQRETSKVIAKNWDELELRSENSFSST